MLSPQANTALFTVATGKIQAVFFDFNGKLAHGMIWPGKLNILRSHDKKKFFSD